MYLCICIGISIISLLFNILNSFPSLNTLPNNQRQYGYDHQLISVQKEPNNHFFFANNRKISPWHNIVFRPRNSTDGAQYDQFVVNMVVEIPRGTRQKNEISTTLPFNPIVHDMINNTFRFIKPHRYNYGAIPQTWENSKIMSFGKSSLPGDNDPFDCLEISHIKTSVGSVFPVRVLGALPLSDSGELDWKVIVINVSDPLAFRLNSLEDMENYFPDEIDSIKTKYFDGDAISSFVSADEAIQVIQEGHEQWKLIAYDCNGEYKHSESIKRKRDTHRKKVKSMASDPFFRC